ncbi:MAG: RNA polymerase sigma factor [Bacteroidota bacterium]
MKWFNWSHEKWIAGSVEEYHPMLLAYLVGKTSDLDLAKDLAQEVWARALKIDLTKIDNMRAYLFKITNNLLIDHYRYTEREKKYAINIQQETVVDNGAISTLNQVATQEQIKSILSKDDYRLLLLEYQGYNNEEIGQKMNMNQKTVANRKSLIKQKLAKYWNYER